mmetsp:Transcript_17906/g.22730  ORF Transcript_17906/g.22730 Transcript_17906/m.22730 type:complete len:91 (+) Transcript_17906:153-425(+)
MHMIFCFWWQPRGVVPIPHVDKIRYTGLFPNKCADSTLFVVGPFEWRGCVLPEEDGAKSMKLLYFGERILNLFQEKKSYHRLYTVLVQIF